MFGDFAAHPSLSCKSDVNRAALSANWNGRYGSDKSRSTTLSDCRRLADLCPTWLTLIDRDGMDTALPSGRSA